MTMPGGNKPVPMDGLVLLDAGVYTFQPSRFIEVYQEFASVSEAVLMTYGTYSVALLNRATWGWFWEQAVALMTAHQIAKTQGIDYESAGMRDQSSAGVVTSKSASTSSLSESGTVSALSTGDDPLSVDLSQTQYGLQLLALIHLIMPISDVVTGGPLYQPGYNQYGWPKVQA